MPELLDAQKKFLNDVLGDDPQTGGMGIHKNNTRLILRDVIKATFPVTTILLGDEYTEYLAHEFVKLFPPDSGDMNGYGADYPEFLKRLPNMRDYPYVPDMAQLEWLAHEAYLSPVKPALTADDLSDVEDPVNMRLHVQPHVMLLRSGWPVDKLWERINAEGKDLKDLSLAPQETFVALYREEGKIALQPLTEGSFKFLEHLQSNPSFAFAAEAAIRHETAIALDQMLARMVQEKIFSKNA